MSVTFRAQRNNDTTTSQGLKYAPVRQEGRGSVPFISQPSSILSIEQKHRISRMCIQHIMSHLWGELGHLGDTSGVVADGAVGIDREAGSKGGQHTDRGQGNTLVVLKSEWGEGECRNKKKTHTHAQHMQKRCYGARCVIKKLHAKPNAQSENNPRPKLEKKKSIHARDGATEKTPSTTAVVLPKKHNRQQQHGHQARPISSTYIHQRATPTKNTPRREQPTTQSTTQEQTQ